MEHLVRLAGGDAREALTALEAAAGGAARARAPPRSTSRPPEQAVDRAALRYDRAGDQHYDVISAFIKSMRGSDVDAALHYLARMIEAGEDPRFIARRLVILGQRGHRPGRPDRAADAVAAAQAVQLIGTARGPDQPGPGGDPPRARPEVQRRDLAIDAASADVRAGTAGRCPRTCATRTTPAPAGSATARATGTRTTSPAGSSPSSTPRTWSGTDVLPTHRRGAKSR